LFVFIYRLLINPSISSNFSQFYSINISKKNNENVLPLTVDLTKFVLTKQRHVCHVLASHLLLRAYPRTVFPINKAADALLLLIHLLYETNIEGDDVWHLETIPFHYIVAVNTIGRGNHSNCQTLIYDELQWVRNMNTTWCQTCQTLLYAELQWVRNMNTTWCQTICVQASIPIQQCQLKLQIRKPIFNNLISMIMLATCSNKLYVPLGL